MIKALILARGLGTRMQRDEAGAHLTSEQQQLAQRGAKGLMPICGRPFLDFLIAELLDAGVTQIALVIGPEHDMLREYGGSLNAKFQQPNPPAPFPKREGGDVNTRTPPFLLGKGAGGLGSPCIHFCLQEQPLGTANAVLAGRDFTGDDDAIVLNSDNLYSTETLKLLVEQPRGASYVAGYERDALIGRSNLEAERVKRLAVVQADEGGTMTCIIEKPDQPDNFATNGRVLLSLNCFRFAPRIFEACAKVGKSPRGEYELPEAVVYLKDVLGEPVRVLPTTGLFIDMTSRGDVAAVERLLIHRKLGF